jgi:hypothetical protein
MFALLTTLSKDAAVEAAYYAIRLLRYKNVLGEFTRTQILNKGLPPSSSMIVRAVKELIHEIEYAEGRRIEELPDSTTERFRVEISNIVMERSAREVGYNAEEGKRLVRELRETAHLR